MGRPSTIADGVNWPSLLRLDGDALETHYRHILTTLGQGSGLIPVIFRKAQNKIQDPAKLRRLVELIDGETWTGLDIDVKGRIYEGLLEKNAQDTKSGAGQYFTPRPLIQAIVDVMRPAPGETICDPACGTGGFPAGGARLRRAPPRAARPRPVAPPAPRGAARLGDRGQHRPPVRDEPVPARHRRQRRQQPDPRVGDSLAADPGERFDMVLTNPPFGKKSSVTFVNEEGETRRESQVIVRDDFWTSTSNKQLNFVQHVNTILEMHGRAAVVVPDNVLFEGGAGETVRRKLLHECDVHTLLRLPTGIFYAQGVKANVLFFDKKPGGEKPWTDKLWIYDLRTNQHFTLKQNPLARADLDEFVACYHAENRHQRAATWSEANPQGRWRAYAYDELMARDKANLDIFWLRDESLEDSANLPDPDVLAAEIVEDLQAALEQFAAIAGKMGGSGAAATNLTLTFPQIHKGPKHIK